MTHTSTEQERQAFEAWNRTHEDEHGAVDEASAWAAWSARSIQRVPLSDEQIAAAATAAGMKPIYDKPKKPKINALGSSVPFSWLKDFAHGITQEKQR